MGIDYLSQASLVQAMTPEQLKAEADKLYWYHTIDLGRGVVAQGDYDMSQYVEAYRFPSNLKGKKVLDVGRASGYFAFLFEELGATVTATELSSFLDWDFVGGEAERERRRSQIDDLAAFTHQKITGAFFLAHAARHSKVVPVYTSVYDIKPDTFGSSFDVVFAGSITSHLRDPVLALERLRSVTAPSGVCIVSAPYIDLDESMPLAAMVGTADSGRRSWWVVNQTCLIEMFKAAGFSRADVVGKFDLIISRLTRGQGVFPHIVVHAKP